MPDKARVLIVEDEFLLALQLEDILHDAGHSVIATLADRAALEVLGGALGGSRLGADVALVDLNLRDGLTGPDVAHQLCERFGTRVIYVTANPGQIGAPASGAVGVVQKPFHRDAILSAIQYVLAGCPETGRPVELEMLTAPH